MVHLYIQSFLSPLLSSHTGLSLRCHLLGSPIGIETKESSRGHNQAPIFFYDTKVAVLISIMAYCINTHTTILVRALFILGSCVKYISIDLIPLILDDCGRWSPLQAIAVVHQSCYHP